MKLDRNTKSRTPKYFLVHNRRVAIAGKLDKKIKQQITEALDTLRLHNVIEEGLAGKPDEFFVIKLRDKFAPAALEAYAKMASEHDAEFAEEVLALAERARVHPLSKFPD